MAWQAERRQCCPGCGEPRTETTARGNEFAYRAGVLRCHACAAKERAHTAYTNKLGAEAEGLLVHLTRTPHTPRD